MNRSAASVEQRREYARQYAATHREQQRANARRRHVLKRDEILVRLRQYHRANRLKVFAAYGGAICKCCGETTYEFLSVDHIDGRGRADPKARQLYGWLIKQGFPSGFQVLCHNCNFAKGAYGQCPHLIEKEAVA